METQKASERTRAHLNTPGSINREFKNMTDLQKSAEGILTSHEVAIDSKKDKEKKAGFDIDDMQSIVDFKLGYCPLGNKVIIKEIQKIKKKDDLIIIDKSNTIIQTEFYVIAYGLLVDSLRKGDIILLNAGNVNAVKRIFKGVEFYEVEFYDISGIYHEYEIIEKRVKTKK